MLMRKIPDALKTIASRLVNIELLFDLPRAVNRKFSGWGGLPPGYGPGFSLFSESRSIENFSNKI